MAVGIAALSLILLMLAAYRGMSVILMAPLLAMLAVFLTEPSAVPAVFSGLFMEKVGSFLKLYFPVFLLGALFGKLIEISGFSRAIVTAAIGFVGAEQAIPAIMLVTALLTYGGVSVFVAVFAVYPFAAEMFRRADIPKRLVPATIGLGAITFTMDAMPGTPQIQNIIPTSFFGTTAWAAPVLGLIGSACIMGMGLAYLGWRRRALMAAGEGYGAPGTLVNEPEPVADEVRTPALIALLPLLVVGFGNLGLTMLIPRIWPGEEVSVPLAGLAEPVTIKVAQTAALWAVEGALLLGIATILLFAFPAVAKRFADGSKAAVGGALLAGMNTAVEYGFGAVIAALPGFLIVKEALKSVPNPLLNEAITVTSLAGITGSASGGLSIALAAMADPFMAAGDAAGIPREVLHRVASMASGGMDSLPHNGAIITLLAVTGLTHRQAYKDIFALTLIKTLTVFIVIAVYYLTGWV
ncbi:GntP family permease [Sphingobium baderi]|uniref:Transporter n=1 Tax=Sphingobium baderi LL03 TaxID=1114964 RepID=T0HH81_9SPHN|nr:GntP family permease [Sphingobium baderi]EQA96903.1 transporter [Sphingobium baderi LL03]KMS64070.1 transporter [Sphingobium baderi LL03]